MLLAWWVSLLERRGLKLMNRLDPLELHKAMELKWMLSKVLDQPAKLANRYLFSQEPDLHARRRTYISGHILVELLSSRSLWFLGPASHLLARTVHIQRGGKLNKQAIQVYRVGG